MRNLLRLVLGAALLSGLVSCVLSRSAGLAAPFGPTGEGSTSLVVVERVPVLAVGGTVRVDSGQLIVALDPPHGAEIVIGTYGVGPATIDYPVTAPEAGTWVLRVESVSGTGEYNLRMYY